jgi:hypothetical protein
MKHLLSTLLLVFLPMIMFSQQTQNDIIKTTDSRTIQALVVEIDLQTVKYRLASNPDGPIHTMRKTDIMTITYKNGDVEVYNTTEHLNLRDDLLRAQKLKSNGYVWMYVGFGVAALGYGLDWWIGEQYLYPDNRSTWSTFDATIGPAVIIAGSCMVIGGGIAVLTGINRMNKLGNNAIYCFSLY